MSIAWRRMLQTVPVLFLVAAACGIAYARVHQSDDLGMLRMLLEPAQATLVYAGFALLAPGMFAGAWPNWGQALALPVVHTLLLPTVRVLSEGSRPPIERFGESVRYDYVWVEPRFLAVVCLLQMVGMSFLVLSSRKGQAKYN